MKYIEKKNLYGLNSTYGEQKRKKKENQMK